MLDSADGDESSGPAVGDSADTPDVLSIGGATLDRQYEVTNLPEPDGGSYAREVTETFGGVGANVATSFARLGHHTALLTRLGDDGMGDRVLADLDDGPVDTVLVRQKPGTTTHCLIPRDPNGERMIITAGDAMARLRLTDTDRATLRAADAVFLSAYAPDPVSRGVLDIVADPGGPALVFDLSGPVPELRNRGAEPETIDRVVEAADLFVAGEVAAESYLDCPASEAVDALRARGCTRGAVTFGTDGAVLFDGDERVEVSAFDVDVIDTTGAGDAYIAALTDQWLLGDADAADAGQFAAAVAAMNCRAEGAKTGLPDRDRVRSFLAEQSV